MNDTKQNTWLACDKLVKTFDGVTAVDHVTLSLSKGELVAILGPSGCGKSTLLRMIAGLSRPDAGTIWYQSTLWADGRQCVKPEHRDCGMVFQDMALFPHLSIGDNIGFAIPSAQKKQTVKTMLSLVNLDGMAQRMAHELSGGQQQRVALARSLAPGPGLLLLDEPFSSLDLRLRQEMRREVRKILKAQGVTSILVTHDQNEAFAFADTVAVMFQGCIEQHAAPQTLYQQPATQNTAAFVGEANFIEMETALALFPGLDAMDTRLKTPDNVFMCRPEDVVLSRDGLNAEVIGTEFQGGWREWGIRCLSGNCPTEMKVRTDTASPWSIGDKLMAKPIYGCVYSPKGHLQGTITL